MKVSDCPAAFLPSGYADIFSRLVSIPALIERERFELDLLLTIEDEMRVHRPGKAWRRKGWVVLGRALVEVVESKRIQTPARLLLSTYQ